ncbi:hypothetical protein FNV43_RR10486 [Rhamnella rubrinervis]|uniref:Uncharacterized protein n=1 Tax=Rhamnella rubrinervis TaxID=2594499 RepID=A0A8K0MGR6_9ROSA|nr:hypothetical protein FNV43_RR10486 [Rhamnella rubrinervis]
MPPPPLADPGECGSDDAPIVGDGVSSGKPEAASQAVAVAMAIAEGGFEGRRPPSFTIGFDDEGWMDGWASTICVNFSLLIRSNPFLVGYDGKPKGINTRIWRNPGYDIPSVFFQTKPNTG